MGASDVKDNTKEAHPIKVLIADDDAPTRILLRAAVSQWGYEVVDAADGEEAWNILQLPNTPQLMIVDWLMPKLDGIDLCRRIKSELKQRPYVILLTQLSGTTNIVKGLEAGANEFLSKPFNMAELQSRLSVGARIIRYEISLAEKQAKMKLFCAEMDKLSLMMHELVAKMDGLIKECNQAGNDTKHVQLAELQVLQVELAKSVGLLEVLNAGCHLDGDQ